MARVRFCHANPETVLALQAAVIGNVETGAYLCLDLSSEDHREAERILMTTSPIPLRAADALHLALAVGAKAKGVLTYDKTAAAASRFLGFASLPV